MIWLVSLSLFGFVGGLFADIDALIKNHSCNVPFIPEFRDEFFTYSPRMIQIAQKEELVVQDIHTVWDVEKFKTPRIPVCIDEVENRDVFTALGVPRCIHLPIKCPNSDIRIPKEYEQFAEVIQKIFDFEYSTNPHFDEYYAYLTVDQGFVPRESYQRVPGPHVDGLPRDRENPQTVIDHAYLVTNAIPTRFYFQSFDMSKFDLNQHHFFAVFRALADETLSFLLKPFEINLMNAYSVHTPEVAQEDINRTLLRLEFSVLQFDRQGNSINPAFVSDRNDLNYPFTYVPRPIPNQLGLPVTIFLDQPVTSLLFSYVSFDQFGRERLVKALTDFPRTFTSYRNLHATWEQIASGKLNGLVFVRNHEPQGVVVFEEDSHELSISMIYTCAKGPTKEFMLYAILVLKKIAHGKNLVFVEDKNNRPLMPSFERAAKLAGITYYIKRSF